MVVEVILNLVRCTKITYSQVLKKFFIVTFTNYFFFFYYNCVIITFVFNKIELYQIYSLLVI